MQEIKQQLGILTDYYDCWIYAFLANKNYNIEETVAKLIRRADMELNDLATIEVSDWFRTDLSAGSIQYVGCDKEDRITLYCVTCRDFPKADLREKRKKIFDMFMTWATRLRPNNHQCKVTLLVNQRDASVWANSDLSFQASCALRISKFWPGLVDRVYVCCMNRALAAIARPLFQRLPGHLRERIQIYTEAEVEAGKLLEFFDASVLPVPLGGANECDDQTHWTAWANMICDYFIGVRQGLLDGKSVKEYEMELILREEQEAAELASSRPPRVSHSSGHSTVVPEDDKLVLPPACTPIPIGAAADGPLVEMADVGAAPDEFEDEAEAASIYLPNEDPNWPLLVLQDQEEFFRHNFCDMFKSQHVEYGEKFMKGVQTIKDDLVESTGAQRLAMKCPGPARAVTRTLVLILCVFISLHMLCATLWMLTISCAVLVQLLWGLFVKSYYIFPVGLTILLLAHQCCMYVSRGFEVVHCAFRGRVFHMLRPLGTTALVAQLAFYVAIVVMQVVLFVVYGVVKDALSGFQTSFGSAWLVCGFLIALFHITKPFIPVPEEEKARHHQPSGGLSLYLFLAISEEQEKEEENVQHMTTQVLLASTPVVVSIIFGLGFILTVQLWYLIAASIMTICAAVAVNHYSTTNYEHHATNLVCVVTWIFAVLWQYIVVSMGLYGWDETWGPAVVVALVISFAFLAVTVAAARLRADTSLHLLVLRVGYGFAAAFLITGIILCFVVHWGLGLFALGMAVHSCCCFIWQPCCMSKLGILVTSVAVLFIFLAIVLLGWSVYDGEYTIPESATRASSIVADPYYPVCLRRWGPITQLSVVDFSLFALLSRSAKEVQPRDLASFMPDFVYDGIVAEDNLVQVQSCTHKRTNATVLSVKTTNDRMLLLQAVAAWTPSAALTWIAEIAPDNWTTRIIGIGSFVDDLLPYPWKRAVDLTVAAVRKVREGKGDAQNAAMERREQSVFLTGHALGGAFAGIAGARLHTPTVILSSPGILYSRYKFDVRLWDLLHYVTNVHPSNGAISGVDDSSENSQTVGCDEDTTTCQDVRFLVCRLLEACGDYRNRSITSCS